MQIGFAGDGWGAVSAVSGLKKYFHLEICTNTREVQWLLRDKDRQVPELDNLSAEIIVCAGYKKIVPKELLLRKKIINIHYSLLPKYRGFHATVWAILNNEKKLGFTIHLMNEYIDDGPILYQSYVDNDFIASAAYYMQLFNDKVERCIADVVLGYIEGTIHPLPQNKSLATWVGKRTLKDCKINFLQDIDYLKAFFRALNDPYPRPFFCFEDKTYGLKDVAFHQSNCITHCGQILNIDNDGIWVKVKDGYIILREIFDTSIPEKVEISDFKIGQFLQ